MSHFSGYPLKKPKHPKSGEDSGTESASGTEISSIYAMSRATPAFHLFSDQQDIEIDTPKKKGKQKEGPSTQGFIQDLVEQNQRANTGNGLFGSIYTFGGKEENDGVNEIFGMPFGYHHFNQYQHGFAHEPFSFGEKNDYKNQNQSFFNQGLHNWQSQMNFNGEKQNKFHGQFKEGHIFSFQNNSQLDQKSIGWKPQKNQSLIESFKQNHASPIFQVREDLEGLTNPMEGQSQSNSQQMIKEPSEYQNGYQSVKRSQTDHQNLRQSIIKALSEMDSDQWSQKKLSQSLKTFGIQEKSEPDEDKDTNMDGVNDLVKNSLPQYFDQNQMQQKPVKPWAGSQKKKIQNTIQIDEFNHRNSTKTFFQFRKRNQASAPAQIIKFEETLSSNKSSFDESINVDDKQKGKKEEQPDQNTFSIKFVESIVAEINLENLPQIKSSIFSSTKNQNQTENKHSKKGSFFKNKPLERLNQTKQNQRKNNFLRTEELEKKKTSEKKVQTDEKQKNQPSRRFLFTGFNGNRRRSYSNENSPIEYSHTNPLPIEDYEKDTQTITKPFEHYSEEIQHFSCLQTKPNQFQKLDSTEKVSFFAKRNRNLGAKKVSEDVSIEKKPLELKSKPQLPIFKKLNQVKGQPELKKKEEKIASENQNQKENTTNIKANKVQFLRQNDHGRVKITKIQIKQDIDKASHKVILQKIVENKPRQGQFFGFERRKNRSKQSKTSDFSTNSNLSEMGLDMKGIFDKVNEPKKENNQIVNFKGSMVVHDLKPKINFDFKNKSKIQGVVLKQIKEEEKKQIVFPQKLLKNQENQVKKERKPRFSQYIDMNSRQKVQDTSVQKQKSKPLNSQDQTLTIEKEKPRQTSTIPKYIFSKKTPPKNPLITYQEIEKKQVLARNQPMNIEFVQEKVEPSIEKPKKIFESRKKFTVESVSRSNYMINKERQGFKEETESQKLKHRTRRADVSDYPSLASHSSTRSELIREVEGLIELVEVAKRRMRKKKRQSEEFLHQTQVLKKKVDDMFPEERIKKLMDWKYV